MARGKKTLKQPPADRGNRLNPDGKEVNTDELPPVFALRTAKGWAVCDCEKLEKAAFADKLHELSQKKWRELTSSDRTSGLGSEHIPQKAIKGKTGIPEFITNDVTLLCFRCSQKFRIVGFRSMQVLNIVWLDPNHKLF